MKIHLVITAMILLTVSSASAELRFVQDNRGITSHVVYNGSLYPVLADGTVKLDGHKVPISVLQSSSRQPVQQTHGNQWQNPDMINRQYVPQQSNRQQSRAEYNNTRNATKREIKHETRKMLGGGTGSGVAGAMVEDILSSIF